MNVFLKFFMSAYRALMLNQRASLLAFLVLVSTFLIAAGFTQINTAKNTMTASSSSSPQAPNPLMEYSGTATFGVETYPTVFRFYNGVGCQFSVEVATNISSIWFCGEIQDNSLVMSHLNGDLEVEIAAKLHLENLEGVVEQRYYDSLSVGTIAALRVF